MRLPRPEKGLLLERSGSASPHTGLVQITRQAKEEDVNQAALIEQLRQSTSFLWLVLALVWVVSALRTKRTIKSQSSAAQLLYTAILVVGVYLIFAKQTGIPWLDRQLFSVTVPIVLVGPAHARRQLEQPCHREGKSHARAEGSLSHRPPPHLQRHPVGDARLGAPARRDTLFCRRLDLRVFLLAEDPG
jgi:hypothetical protein